MKNTFYNRVLYNIFNKTGGMFGLHFYFSVLIPAVHPWKVLSKINVILYFSGLQCEFYIVLGVVCVVSVVLTVSLLH